MNLSDLPKRFPIPFASGAASGYIRDIPTDPVTPSTGDAPASLYDGFPPETFAALSAGGVPPSGADFNGMFYLLSAWARWVAAGGPAVYNATFQAAIGGYPKGAVIRSASIDGAIYRSLVDANTTNPDTGGAGWVKEFDRGSSGGVNWRIWPDGYGGRMARFSGSISFVGEGAFGASYPFSLASVTDYGVSTVIPSAAIHYDQMAQVVGTPGTTQIITYMQKFGGGDWTWPISARWWVEGVLP